MTADADGRFSFRTLMPHNYKPERDALPDWIRGKHVHFMISASGYETLVTEVSLAPDEHIDEDPWRVGRESLVTNMTQLDNTADGKEQYQASFDFVLELEGVSGYARALRELGAPQ